MQRSFRSLAAFVAWLLSATAALAAEQQPCPSGTRCETPATGVVAASPAVPAPTVDAAPPKPSGSDSGLSLAVLTHLGFGTPTGLAGMSVDFMPVRYVAIEVGAGTNLEGMEYEAGARARLPVLNNGRYFTIGAGWCEAMHYTADESANGILGFARIAESMGESSTSDTVWRHAQFFNTELGIETQEKHLLTRIYTGYAKLFNPATHTCSDAALPCKPDAGTGLVYVGVGFGYAF